MTGRVGSDIGFTNEIRAGGVHAGGLVVDACTVLADSDAELVFERLTL